MSTYYIVRWKDPKYEENGWHASTMAPRPTKVQAMQQLQEDVRYFYSDIEIQLIQVEETVIETHHGSNTRPTPLTQCVPWPKKTA